MHMQHLVFPGQVIAVTSIDSSSSGGTNDNDSFLRGHGTYVETSGLERRLIASVTGTVQRVNKLVSVQPVSSSLYQAHTGDLIVGRITAVGTGRWNVELLSHKRTAALPLSGVHLPGGVQRMRTAQDAREMRQYLAEGDLVSAEVHKVQPADGTVFLHTRSFRYGKLENGCLVTVPPSLVPRRKNHYVTISVPSEESPEETLQLEVLFGCNGMIWMQRKLQDSTLSATAMDNNTTNAAAGGQQELAELQEQRRAEHAATPYSIQERRAVARLRNCVECLRLTSSPVTPESLQDVYAKSLSFGGSISQMLLPAHAIELTASQRP